MAFALRKVCLHNFHLSSYSEVPEFYLFLDHFFNFCADQLHQDNNFLWFCRS